MSKEKFKILEEAEQTADRLLSQRAEEIDGTRAKMAEVDTAINTALEKLEKATFEGNELSYQQAQAELDRAQRTKDYHKKRLEAITAKPLITDAEYNRLINGIYNEFSELDAQTREKLATLCDELTKIADNYNADVDRINTALHRLQCDVYRLADCRQDRNGRHYIDPTTEKRVKFSSTLNWAMCAAKNVQYREYRGLPNKITF